MIEKIKNIILENKKICILSFVILLAILLNALAQLFVFGGIAWAIYYCVRNPQKIRSYIKKEFSAKNISITIIAALLCAVFSFFIVFMGAASGAGLANYNGDKDSWNYFFSANFVKLLLMMGMFILPAITILGLIGFWGDIKPKLSKYLMFSAPLMVLFVVSIIYLIDAVALALSAIGFEIY